MPLPLHVTSSSYPLKFFEKEKKSVSNQMGLIIKSLVSMALIALLVFSKSLPNFANDDGVSNFNDGMLHRNLLQTTDRHQIAKCKNENQHSFKQDINKKHRRSAKKANCPNKSLANRSGTMSFGIGSLLFLSIVYGFFF